ncbi:MAG: C39 family peptidase [Nitrospirota bacterium]
MRYNYIKVSLVLIVFILTLPSTAKADVCAYECGNVPIMDCDRVTIGCTDFKILKGYAFYYCIYRDPGYILVLYKRPVDTSWLVLDWGYQDTSAGREFMYNRMIQVAKDTAHWWCPGVEECIKSISLPLQIVSNTANVWCPSVVPIPCTPLTAMITDMSQGGTWRREQLDEAFWKDGRIKTIGERGCALTAVAMLLGGYGVKTPEGGDVNPENLNTWLNNNKGFYKGGDIDWKAINTYTTKIRFTKFIGTYKYNFKEDKPLPTTMLNNYLDKCIPVIVLVARINERGERSGHWVLVTERQGDRYIIKDPAISGPVVTTTLSDYGNKIYAIRVYEEKK